MPAKALWNHGHQHYDDFQGDAVGRVTTPSAEAAFPVPRSSTSAALFSSIAPREYPYSAQATGVVPLTAVQLPTRLMQTFAGVSTRYHSHRGRTIRR